MSPIIKKLQSEFTALGAHLRKEWQLLRSYRFLFILNGFAIGLAVANYFFMGKSVTAEIQNYSSNYFEYVLLGIMTASFLLAISNGMVQQLGQEMQTGSFEILLTAPRPSWLTLIYSSLWNILQAVITALGYLAVAVIFFHLEIGWLALLQALSILALSSLVFLSLALFSATALLFFKKASALQWILASVQMALGSIYFPIAKLPPLLQLCAKFLPLSYSVEAIRKTLLLHTPLKNLSSELTVLLCMAAIGLPLAIFSWERCLTHIKRHGTLTQY
jgi:ABC-2 type transport system permease protein